MSEPEDFTVGVERLQQRAPKASDLVEPDDGYAVIAALQSLNDMKAGAAIRYINALRAKLAAAEAKILTLQNFDPTNHHNAEFCVYCNPKRLKLMDPSAESQLKIAREALEFYANPESYHAVAVFGDPPCGEIADDFSEDDWTQECGYSRPMLGKRAREVLRSLTSGAEK